MRLPPRSPNLNTDVERFVLSIKDECLNRMIFFREQSLRRAVVEFVRHYHGERNHQGMCNAFFEPLGGVGSAQGSVQCRRRLGELLKTYYREAAVLVWCSALTPKVNATLPSKTIEAGGPSGLIMTRDNNLN